MPDPVQRAKQLLNHFATGAFDEVMQALDENMQQMVPRATLERSWAQIVSEAGKLVSVTDAELDEGETGLQVIKLFCKFERGELVCNLAFSPDDRVMGLHFHAARL